MSHNTSSMKILIDFKKFKILNKNLKTAQDAVLTLPINELIACRLKPSISETNIIINMCEYRSR